MSNKSIRLLLYHTTCQSISIGKTGTTDVNAFDQTLNLVSSREES